MRILGEVSTKRIVSWAATAFLVAAAIWYLQSLKSGGVRHPPLEKLIIGSPLQEISALAYIAEKKGFFSDQGLDVTIRDYDSGVTSVKGLLDGEIDIALTAEYVFVSESFDHSDMKVLAAVADADITEMIARKDRGIHEIGDLRGKKIGVTRKGSAEFVLGTFLTFQGLSLRDVTLVDLPPQALVKGISTGKVDAAITWPPHTLTIKNTLGDKAISWSAQSGHRWYWLAVTTEKAIRDRAPVIRQFLDALLHAERYAKEKEAGAKDIVAKRMSAGNSYISYYWPKHTFAVTLPQGLLLSMEDEARWRIRNSLTFKKEVPNFLRAIHLGSLESLNRGAVTVIRERSR